MRYTSSAALKIALGQKLGLHLQSIEKWRAIAELGCVPKVGYQYGGLLLHSGIANIGQLAAAQPGPIHRNVLRLQVAHTRRRDLCPSCSEIKGWIKQAQQLVNS
ncbi:MAG: DUF4332 domain-containing protein [Synechococcaceae cyanobacterium RL_1_2]|nr:DUF4332 domain-containing protein [Synechococcaceae cyanobacterium RL_1_2]